jgi:hypothetical protein
VVSAATAECRRPERLAAPTTAGSARDADRAALAAPSGEVRERGDGSGDARADAAQAAAAPVVFTVADRRVRLADDGVVCRIFHRAEKGDPEQELPLELAPPCHLVVWRVPPPARPSTDERAAAGAAPVGGVGEPMAWRYRTAGNAVVLAVIGDPIRQDQRHDELYLLRTRQGMHCSASVQGVLLGGGAAQVGVKLGKKRSHIGILCAELGLEQKDFWILAHDR